MEKNSHPLRTQRKLLGLSIEKAAEKAGIGRSTAAAIESGSETVEYGNVKKYAEVMGYELVFVLKR
jgi:transcriptional regulator with XRE-family HTH domain